MPCGNCALCRSLNDLRHQRQTPVIVFFYCYEQYRFVNGYESILNCPATCTAQNIIYVLTCLCGQFNYIGQNKIVKLIMILLGKILIDDCKTKDTQHSIDMALIVNRLVLL